MNIRRASAWGFHPFNRVDEEKEIENSFLSKYGGGEIGKVSVNGMRNIIGGVVPHAGYIYSGPIASNFYYQLAEDGNPETFVILGPNHRGYPGYCTMLEGVWRMPLGDVKVDATLSKAVVKYSQFIDVNAKAHENEHSIEVQIPFLQYIYKNNFEIVPITVGYADYGMCKDVGIAISNSVKDSGRDVVILGSTDFTHYGSSYGYAPAGTSPFEKILKWIYEVDNYLIEIILSLNDKKLVKEVEEKRYTMCGSLPVATMIVATKELGAKSGKLLKYATSYDTQGSKDVIVGYGAIVIMK